MKAADEEQVERAKEGIKKPLEGTGIVETINDASAEMEQKANQRRASSAAEEARAEKIAAIAAVEAQAEKERAENQAKALAAMDAARDEKLAASEQKASDSERERKMNVMRAKKAADAEQRERVLEHGDSIRTSPAHMAITSEGDKAKEEALPGAVATTAGSDFELCGSAHDDEASHTDIAASLCGGHAASAADGGDEKKKKKKKKGACVIS